MIDMEILKQLFHVHILIVEDDELTAHALQQTLSLHCQYVQVAKDGLEGIEIFERDKPDIVISDINLPKMNGLEMISWMHKVSPNLPTIIITSYDSPENISESINQGAYNYLRKPIKIEELQIALLMATKDIYDSKIVLEEDFVYDNQKRNLYNKKGIVKLTKLEQDLLHLLICNANQVVDYFTIENYIWQDKSMSLKSLRMCVKNIRTKTYPHIVENISKCGYRLNTPSK